MLPKFHILLGFIFASVLFALFEEVSLFFATIIFFASFLIDTDHYLYYVYKKKDINLRRAYAWFVTLGKSHKKMSLEDKEKFYIGVHIFHGLELVGILWLLGTLFYTPLVYVTIGFVFHLFLDLISETTTFGRYSRLSFIYVVVMLKELEHIEENSKLYK